MCLPKTKINLSKDFRLTGTWVCPCTPTCGGDPRLNVFNIFFSLKIVYTSDMLSEGGLFIESKELDFS